MHVSAFLRIPERNGCTVLCTAVHVFFAFILMKADLLERRCIQPRMQNYIEIHLPLILQFVENFSHRNTSHILLHTSHHVPCYIPRTSHLNLFTEVYMYFKRKYKKKKWPLCNVMEVINRKTPFISIFKKNRQDKKQDTCCQMALNFIVKQFVWT